MRLQYNKTTGVDYEGMNQAILLGIKDDSKYRSNAWITFVQARTAGYKLVNAKGKGIGLRTFINDVDEKGKDCKKPYYFCVFNCDHIKKI